MIRPSRPRLPHRLLLMMLSACLCPAQAAADGSAERATEHRAAEEESEPFLESPGPRQAQWIELRRQKAQGSLQPYSPGFMERTFLAIEKAERPSILHWNLFGLYPRVAGVARRSTMAPGARFWQPDIAGSGLSVHGSAFYSFRKFQYFDLQVGRIPHRPSQMPRRATDRDDIAALGSLPRKPLGLILYASVEYRDFPRLDFQGIGPDSSLESQTTYRRLDTAYELIAGYQLSSWFSVIGRGGLTRPTIKEGTDPELPSIGDVWDDSTAPGLDRQPDFLRFSVTLQADGRDEPSNPHRGAMLAIEAIRFGEKGGEEFDFERLAFDGRMYLPLGSPQRILALRAHASVDDRAANGRVPFYLMEGLGGSHTLRGFSTYRFIGEKLLLLQAEYRWEAAPALELVLFAEAGAVSDLARNDLGRFRNSFGFGLRLKTVEDVLLRLDVGFSNETTRVLLRASPSF